VLEKEVSLHFLPPEVRADLRAMEGLRLEVKRARQFIHPQILRVYDLIEEKESAAIAMDCFAAESLATVLSRKDGGFFEARQIKPWVASLCKTLEDAHKIQLLHQDISPANILVDKAWNVVVTKFGISRLIRDAESRVRGGGEPDPGLAYMSPQQLDGDRPTIADDVYAFGALLHELLSGAAPFVGKDIVPQIRRTPAPTIADHRAALRRSGGPIPANWEALVAACLAKDPEQRPKSMAEVASQLALETIDVVSAPAPEATMPPAAGGVTSGQIPVAPFVTPPLTKAGNTAGRTAPRMPEPKIETTIAPHVFAAATPKAVAKPEPVKSAFLGKHELLGKAQPVPKTESLGKVLVAAPPSGRTGSSMKALPLKPERVEKTELREKPPGKPSPPKPEVEPDVSDIAVSDQYSSFDLGRSSFPLTGLAAAAILVMIGVYGLFFYEPGRAAREGLEVTTNNSAAQDSEFTAVTNSNNGEDSPPPSQKTLGSDAVAASPADASVPVAANVAAKSAALEKAQQAFEAAEKAHQEVMKQKEQVEAATAQAQKELEDKTREAAPVLKAAEEVVAQRKAREEQMRAAEVAAQQAQQMAVEKARVADEAKKTLANVEKEEKAKVVAQEKAESELKELEASIEEKRRRAAEMAKALIGAATHREEQAALVKQTGQELAEAKIAAQKAAEEAARQMAEKRRKIEAEIAEARAAFEKKIAELERALKASDGAPVTPADSGPPARPDTSKPPAPKPVTSAPIETVAVPGSASAAVNSAAGKNPFAETLFAMKTQPGKPPTTPTPEAQKGGGAQAGFENSLGMKFLPVGDVLFCIWQTRVKDFEPFARATGLKSTVWRDPGFRQGPDHPVVNVTWREAIAFCKWLTAKEQKEGLLAQNQEYRLPYDLEWSKAVDLPEETGKTPEARDMGVPDLYPWGNGWPPPNGAGNYTGEETGSDMAIKGYDDGFAWTSPVGSFAGNKYGLYDMGGNVWQWCIDGWNAEQKEKVLRGASWSNGALKLNLLSSCRLHSPPDSSTDNYGFRCVLAATESSKSSKK
jgi:formylglycine-generating enzyme required for sulfatase activity